MYVHFVLGNSFGSQRLPKNSVSRLTYRCYGSTNQSIHYCYICISGLTGIILTIIVIVMYVFAVPYARRHLFKAFWFTHSWYILLYLFTIMHGSGRLVQPPLTQNYLLGPPVVYIFDKLISFSRKKIEITVKKAELLPSGKS